MKRIFILLKVGNIFVPCKNNYPTLKELILAKMSKGDINIIIMFPDQLIQVEIDKSKEGYLATILSPEKVIAEYLTPIRKLRDLLSLLECDLPKECIQV